MMRTVRFGLVVALALLIAAPVLAQGGGKGKRGGGGMFGGGMGVAVIRAALRTLDLTADEKTAIDEILAGVKEKDAELGKAAAPTTDQQAAIKEAMTKARDDGTPMNQMADIINKAAKWTDEQTKARTDRAALVKETAAKVKDKLTGDDKKAAFEKAMTAPRGGRGKGKPKDDQKA